MTRERHDDVVLGESLAETAALNTPEQTASRRADEAVRRAARGHTPRRIRRRAFAISVAVLLTAIAGLGVLLWLLGPPS